MTLPTCCICGRECVPLADYDVPTCIGCDLAMEAIATRAGAAAPVVLPAGVVCRRCRTPDVKPVDLDLGRPLHTYFGPGDPDLIAQVVDAICPLPVHRKHATTGAAA